MTLDFRSDTVTRPSKMMLDAMAAAKTGDDVFEEDPTVNLLEETMASLFAKQAALFLPSGTMANLIAIALHCGRGDQVIMERRTHSNSFEVGGISALLGVFPWQLDLADGFLNAHDLAHSIRSENVHFARTTLAVVENSANLAGGLIVPLEEIKKIRQFCQQNSLALHIDGARIWNTAAATGIALKEWAAECDTLSCCLSKGLGCPVGSMLIGNKELIYEARRIRKMLGGGMRQAGVLAAAGLYALEHHLGDIDKDHLKAKNLYELIYELYPELNPIKPETNILLIDAKTVEDTSRLLNIWQSRGIKALAIAPTVIRLVLHRDIPVDCADLFKAQVSN
jgi:threonine aldolase